jgi:hypothetical protein
MHNAMGRSSSSSSGGGGGGGGGDNGGARAIEDNFSLVESPL